jgi:glycosyltransferase involved in cell wall biosynthesis
MKVLQIIGWPLSIGGHISSSYALARAMREHGLEITVAAPQGSFAAAFTSARIGFIPCDALLRRSPWHLFAAFRIFSIARRTGAELLHAMDYKALYPSFLAASALGVPLFFTKAGGAVPNYQIPEVARLVVFSEELLQGIGDGYPALSGRIELIKERVDTELFVPTPLTDHSKCGMLRLFMAMRCEEGKRVWLEGAIAGLNVYANSGGRFEMVLAGDGPLRSEMEALAGQITDEHGSRCFRFLGGISEPSEMVRHYQTADVVIGHGRGVLEAMSCAKPVVVLGSESGATLVCPDTVGAISKYNFSGRHMKTNPAMMGGLAEILSTVADDAETRRQLGIFSRQYVEAEYSLTFGARRQALMYEQAGREGDFVSLPAALIWLIRAAWVRGASGKR